MNENEKTDRELIEEIHASQLRTEETVTEFINQFKATMDKNPVLKMFGGMVR